MMKRNTEGFALAYVVIVIAVLTTLSIGLMSISLRILQVQDKNMQRMQDKYAAQGEMELLMAELEEDLSESSSTKVTFDANLVDGSLQFSPSDLVYLKKSDAFSAYEADPNIVGPAIETARRDIISVIGAEAIKVNGVVEMSESYLTTETISSSKQISVSYAYEVPYEKKVGNSSVLATLSFEISFDLIVDANAKVDGDESVQENVAYTYGYDVTDVSIEYVDYRIVSEGGGAS